MIKQKDNIVSLISQRTGSPEEITEKVITAFGEFLSQAASEKKATVIPEAGYIMFLSSKRTKALIKGSEISKSDKWYLAKKSPITDNLSVVEEQPVKYSSRTRRQIMNELKSVRKSNETLDRLLVLSSLPQKFLAETILEISTKTLYTYRRSDLSLPVRITEQILKLEELYTKGIEIFESSGKFNSWLKSESYGLGGIIPVQIINSITGIDMVYEELVRIEFGATA